MCVSAFLLYLCLYVPQRSPCEYRDKTDCKQAHWCPAMITGHHIVDGKTYELPAEITWHYKVGPC